MTPSMALAEETRFFGPAKQPFNSFLDLAVFSLESNCRSWRNYDRPASHIIPPIFCYQNPDLDDEVIENAVKEGAASNSQNSVLHKPVIFRHSDEAEHIVYNVIHRLIEDNVGAPFLAIHHLNIQNTKKFLFNIFPDVQWKAILDPMENCLQEILDRLNVDESLKQFLKLEFYQQFSRGLGKSNMEFDKIMDNIDIAEVKQKEIRGVLAKTFNDFFREYDFVMIGPKIGIVVIEVKHQSFFKIKEPAGIKELLAKPTGIVARLKAKQSYAKSNLLPSDVIKGINQLNSFDFLLNILQEVTGIKVPKECVRKILFTPNSKRKLFNQWHSLLEKEAKSKCDKYLEKIDAIWFSEDMVNSALHCQKTGLYSTFQRLIASNQKLPQNVFETFCPLMVGLASAAVLKNTQCVELSSYTLCQTEAVVRESELVETQDPLGVLQQITTTTVKRKKLVQNPEELRMVKLNKVIILTPEQNEALKGPVRQFIIGTAGSGKTIILQVKALELLKQGKSVCVITTRCYASHYKKLFDENGYNKYEIRTKLKWRKWPYLENKLNHETSGELFAYLRLFMRERLRGMTNTDFWDTDSPIKLLLDNDALIVDDMLDSSAFGRFDLDQSTIPIFALYLMEFAEMICPQKTMWAAFDVRMTLSQSSNIAQIRLLQGFLELDTIGTGSVFPYVITKLNRIMRCSENIFQAAYDIPALRGQGYRPMLGHKLQGIVKRIRVKEIDNGPGTWELFWTEIKKQLDNLIADGFSFNDVAVIVNDISPVLKEFLLQKCETFGFPATIVVTTGDQHQMLSSSVANENHKGKLMIYDASQVSSMEWPIVIYVSSDRQRLCYENFLLQNHRARSRAMGQLIEIFSYHVLKRRRSVDFNEREKQNKYLNWHEIFYTDEVKPKQLTNMAGDCYHLLDFSATILRINYANRRNLLWKYTRRRSYSVHEINTQKHSLRGNKKYFDQNLCRFSCRFVRK